MQGEYGRRSSDKYKGAKVAESFVPLTDGRPGGPGAGQHAEPGLPERLPLHLQGDGATPGQAALRHHQQNQRSEPVTHQLLLHALVLILGMLCAIISLGAFYISGLLH